MTATRRFVAEFLAFGLKQAYACLFGGILLALIVATRLAWPADAPVARYDALLIAAIVVQAVLIGSRLESLGEAKVILLFHLVGTAMEIFKTQVGSWTYPEPNQLRIGGVPLFTGFMYSAVGSYMARVWRLFDFRFEGYPTKSATILLCAAIYVNFFSHHFMPDFRVGLFVLRAWLYGRCTVSYRPLDRYRRMPLLIGFLLVALFIWFAENLATYCAVWRYPNQSHEWHMVGIAKLGSWFLLMIVSFVMVSLLHRIDRAR